LGVALAEAFFVPHPPLQGAGDGLVGGGSRRALHRPLPAEGVWRVMPPRRLSIAGLSLRATPRQQPSPADGSSPAGQRAGPGSSRRMSHGRAGTPPDAGPPRGEAGAQDAAPPAHHFFSATVGHDAGAAGSGASLPPTTAGAVQHDGATAKGKRLGGHAAVGQAVDKERGRRFTVRPRGHAARRGGKPAPGDRARSETLKQVVERGGSLQAGYQVLDRLLQKGGSGKPSAKFFSLLMSLCVANIRIGRATLADAYGVMQRCRDCQVQLDTILFNALLAAVSQEAGRGRATLEDATSVMRQLRAEGLKPDVRTINTLMDVTAKVAGAASEHHLPDEEPSPVTPMSGQSILRLMHQEGLRPNIWTYTSLVSIYAKCAARGPAQTSLAEGAKVRKEMAAGGVTPTEPFINNYINLVAKLAHNGEADLADGYEVVEWASSLDIAPSIITFNALAQVAAAAAARKKASFGDALAVLAMMHKHKVAADLITFNTLLNALSASAGDWRIRDPVGEARSVLGRMDAAGVEPDVVTFSSVLKVCANACEAGRATVHDADGIMQLMRERHFLVIDTVLCNTFLECARADGSMEALELAQDMLAQMRDSDCDSYTYSSIMYLYGKCLGAPGGSKAVVLLRAALEAGTVANTYLFNAAMAANLPHAPDTVFELLEEMEECDVSQDGRTRLLVREAASILGLEES